MYHCTWPSTWLLVSFNRKIGSKKIEKSISLFQRPKKPIKKIIKSREKTNKNWHLSIDLERNVIKSVIKNPIKFDTKNAKHNKHLFFAITNHALHTIEYWKKNPFLKAYLAFTAIIILKGKIGKLLLWKCQVCHFRPADFFGVLGSGRN